MRELNKTTFGFALSGFASSLLVGTLAFLAGAYFICVQYQICLFHPDKFL